MQELRTKRCMQMKLKERYEKACNDYIAEFTKKQEIEFDGWVGDEVGGIASFIDQYFFNISDIVWDINSNQPEGLILQWQDDCLESNPKFISYFSYSRGLRYSDLS